MNKNKYRAPRNRTLFLSKEEENFYSSKILYINDYDLNSNGRKNNRFYLEDILNKTICADFFKVIEYFPYEVFDLIILDPPYNISKKFDKFEFKEIDELEYKNYFENIINKIFPLLKKTGSIYVCCEWKTSYAVYEVLKKYFKIRNRITWEREKGRGAKKNWKNCSEDIWFATKSNKYFFDVEKVKLKRKVIAPYRENGLPKDWIEVENHKYRLTYPSNLWSDITVPFWSMPENTDHPTQKPEKLIAKLILASTKEEDFVFDPFAGSGTTPVVCKKLGRNYCGIEINDYYAKITEKRLLMAENDKTIQGYYDGYFLERNMYNAFLRKLKIKDKN
ncbi:MAG: site-specific DNA-methyltransferase [Spirochaetes bacterium]|nr:site-specific DNA-methyltransferase [Spirochaetota bacterium]